jgi:outer membrane receptor protein involved in Fe transport
MKPNRSWTSILGIKLELPQELSFTVEGYFKYTFNRMYTTINFDEEIDINPNPQFDGKGRIWGIDIMLQRKENSFLDGWLAYSWNWAKYRDPYGGSGMGISGGNRGDEWYFPSYHRFHNLNLILNIKPIQKINIYVRFGLASGTQLSRRVGDGPESYPELIYNKENPEKSYFIEKYLWRSERDDNNRTTPSLPMDIKLTILGTTKKNRKYEVYVAVENVLSLLYTAQGNTRFNSYTGEIDIGSNSASYDIPIPIPSFGFKMSY